jgi:pSer/pThr/pTyr-binding forkhead associated (FHA) protein
MQRCPNCNIENRIGVVFCENCGASLIGDSPLSTRHIGENSPEIAAGVRAKGGTDQLDSGMVLRLEIDNTEPLILKPKRETVLGRRDPATGQMPDVDLTPFAGYRLGVSRRHAALRQNDNNRLDLWDLGSGNGTYLNGVKLIAHRPNRVHDGDEIRLGQMIVRIYFQVMSEEMKKAAQNPRKVGL